MRGLRSTSVRGARGSAGMSPLRSRLLVRPDRGIPLCFIGVTPDTQKGGRGTWTVPRPSLLPGVAVGTGVAAIPAGGHVPRVETVLALDVVAAVEHEKDDQEKHSQPPFDFIHSATSNRLGYRFLMSLMVSSLKALIMQRTRTVPFRNVVI